MQQNSVEPLHQHWGTLEQKSGLSRLTSVNRYSLANLV